MDILNKISADKLTEIAGKWADATLPFMSDEDLNGLMRDSFINGFLAGAIQIRDIVEKAELIELEKKLR